MIVSKDLIVLLAPNNIICKHERKIARHQAGDGEPITDSKYHCPVGKWQWPFWIANCKKSDYSEWSLNITVLRSLFVCHVH